MVYPESGPPLGAALLSEVVHDLSGSPWWEQVSWGMLWSLLLRIRAAYVEPSGFYPEQTEREPLIPTHPPPAAAGSLQPPSKESFATSLQPQHPQLVKTHGIGLQ